MILHQPRYPLEEFAQRGDEIYDRDIRAQVEPEHNEKIVAIDIDTDAWELDPDEDTAADRLEARLPNAQIWVVRVGSRYVRRFGADNLSFLKYQARTHSKPQTDESTWASLYAEFTAEDRELAEAGMPKYSQALAAEDHR